MPDDAGGVAATFACDRVYKGYEDRLHGGIIATLLDAAMTNCLFAHGCPGVTGELTIRFHGPVDLARPARVRAWVERAVHHLRVLRAEVAQEGVVKAAATGKFLEAATSAPVETDDRSLT
jgi:acyl-coenzyme A thioesterase PaaI-like protein